MSSCHHSEDTPQGFSTWTRRTIRRVRPRLLILLKNADFECCAGALSLQTAPASASWRVIVSPS
ncbi:hypothetical protein C0J52_22642 [Blattella germanica]|nr:hypothetical protein C0J52_22642 [Blattella germanica]